MTAVRDLADHDRARLAARLIEQVGEPAVNRWRDGITVVPPEHDIAVLACRCGAVLDAADMHRARPAIPTPPSCLTIRSIVCEACAA